MRRLLSFPFLVVAAAIGCGGVDGPAAPRLIPGGGVGDGAISGTLYVHVTDEETRAVISSAKVRVGESSDPAACEVLTDSTGLAKFQPDSCPGLAGTRDGDDHRERLRARHLDRRQRREPDDPDPQFESARGPRPRRSAGRSRAGPACPRRAPTIRRWR